MHLQRCFGIGDGCFDLHAVANDALVLHQSFDIARGELGNHLWVEALECGTEVFAFAQNGEPRKPCLKTFKTNFFEQFVVVVNGATPFVVVVRNVGGVG